MTWRDNFRPIIARILAAGGSDAELREAWKTLQLGPAKGSGASWPYKIWRDEIARQRGLKQPKRRRAPVTKEEARRWLEKRQMRMF